MQALASGCLQVRGLSCCPIGGVPSVKRNISAVQLDRSSSSEANLLCAGLSIGPSMEDRPASGMSAPANAACATAVLQTSNPQNPLCGLGRRDYFAEMPAQHVLWHSRALLAAWIVSAIGICLQEGNMRTIRREACVSTQESVSLAKGHVLYMRLRDVLSSVQSAKKCSSPGNHKLTAAATVLEDTRRRLGNLLYSGKFRDIVSEINALEEEALAYVQVAEYLLKTL